MEPHDPLSAFPVRNKRPAARWPLYVLGGGAAIFFGGLMLDATIDDQPAAALPAPQRGPSTTVSVDEVLSAYENNQIAGESRFKDAWLVVVGQVDNVNTDILGNAYVTLIRPNEQVAMTSVQCYFDTALELQSLSKGQVIKVEGRCDGKFMNVLLRDSRILP